jgi:signal transduction histidine kinase
MDTPRASEAARKRLATLLRDRKEELIRVWTERVRQDSSVSEATRLSEPDLRDHMPGLVDALIHDLEGPDGGEATGRAIGAGATAREHARHRAANGYSLTEALRELSHFRSAILDLCINAGVLLEDGATKLLHAAIDESMVTGADEMDRAAVDALRRQAAFRERFIGILGHDLRTPIQAIRLGAAALLRRAQVPPEDSRVLLRIVGGAERMGRMIADLLDVTRVRLGGGLPVEPRPADLGEVVQQVLGELEIANPHRRLERVFHGDLRGTWDLDRLAQTFSNLVVNALDYSTPDTAVRVEARGVGPQVLVVVQNEGPMIAPETLSSLFDPFVQGSSSTRVHRESAGLGLGLFIAKQVVEAHGGTIDVTSTSGGGTTFAVRLPRSAPARGASPPET